MSSNIFWFQNTNTLLIISAFHDLLWPYATTKSFLNQFSLTYINILRFYARSFLELSSQHSKFRFLLRSDTKKIVCGSIKKSFKNESWEGCYNSEKVSGRFTVDEMCIFAFCPSHYDIRFRFNFKSFLYFQMRDKQHFKPLILKPSKRLLNYNAHTW